MIDTEERLALLHLARAAIASYVGGLPLPTPEQSPIMKRHAGVFVSLHLRKPGPLGPGRGRDLRGCIGHIEQDRPLATAVSSSAVAAASADPRFAPVTADELAGLHIELSILGALEPIRGPSDIEIGRHGLLVERGWQRGLLLPQVAVEWAWDAETFLAQTCHKAGLPLDAWQSDTSLWRFEAEVFGEAP